MTAESGTAGSTHASQLSEPPPVGAEEPTVVRGPGDTNEDSRTGNPNDVVQPATSVSPTLTRLFDAEQSVFGLRIAEFVLEVSVGSGGMGAVFKAHDTRLSRKVALKVLSPKATLDAQLVSRFHNEARATARLSHDNIARVYSSGEDLGVHYIAYELIDGTNLRDFIAARGIVKPDETLSFAIQIGMALNHTGAAGVVHRDIKPSNIIITPEGRARVVDLGLARRDGEDSIADLTMAGATLGTFDYISPEQAQDPRHVDIRSDIYSLGCTMFHMLTGQPPYPDGTALQKLLDHKGKNAPAPFEINKKVPRDLSAVVHRMMASDPGDRHATPALLVEDLMRVAARMGLRGIQPEGLVWKRPSETRPPFLQANLGWIAVGMVLVVAAMVLRMKPHVVVTDSNSLRFRAVPPAVVEKAKSDATDTTQASADARNANAWGAVADLLWGEGETADDSGNAEENPARKAGLSLSHMLSELANSMRNSLATAPARTAGTGTADMGDSSDPTTSGMVYLQSDPTRPFDTLQAACWAAKDGDVIVVRATDDNTALIEKPLRVVKKSITIRGEPNAGRVPLVRFDLGPEPSDPQSKMITSVGGDIRISNIDIEVVAREDVGAERWVFCAMEGADRVRLDNVNIDFNNPSGLDAAVFEVTLGDEAAIARMQNAAGEYQIRVTGGCVRGNCRGFHIETALPGSLEVSNTVVCLGKPLLYVGGINDLLLDRDRIDMELTHTTCVLGDGLIRMSNIDAVGGPTQQLLPVEVVSENNIFATAGEQPLIRMEGTSAPDEFRSLLQWTGQKNLYDGFGVFWQLDSSLAALGVYEDAFEDWQRYWADAPDSGEVGAVSDSDPWRTTRWRERVGTAMELSDLELDETDSTSEAVGTATDGTNLGADLEALRRPQLPLE